MPYYQSANKFKALDCFHFGVYFLPVDALVWIVVSLPSMKMYEDSGKSGQMTGPIDVGVYVSKLEITPMYALVSINEFWSSYSERGWT